MSKTHKQPYRQGRRFDKTCRNHGACAYCLANRQYANVKRALTADEALRAYEYQVWQRHKHELIPEYDSVGNYRMDVTWRCRLCGQPIDPWSGSGVRFFLNSS